MSAQAIGANIKAAAETSLGEAAIDFDGGLYHPRHLPGAVMTVPSGPLIIAMQKACHLENGEKIQKIQMLIQKPKWLSFCSEILKPSFSSSR